MNRIARAAMTAAALMLLTGAVWAQEAFRYHGPGQLAVGSGRKDDRTVYLRGMYFPLQAGPQHQNAHAYANSQIHPVAGPGNAVGNYAYPWRDTYCEKRSWDMPLCPGKTGHQGLDIRPQKATANAFPAFAMDDGVVASITNNTTVTIRANAGYVCRYLHLDRSSITQAGLKIGSAIKRGDLVGRVSNIMGGVPNTTIHLHFDCYKSISGKVVRLPIFASLIAAYRRAWGLDDLDRGGQLAVDPIREMGAFAVASSNDGTPVGPAVAAAADAALPKSLRTKNFGAITPSTEPAAWPAYILKWPGLIRSVEIRDAFGKIIPAFATDEAGVGLWWYWMVQRAGFGASGVVSFEKIALKYSGASTVDEPVVAKYVTAYSGAAERPGLSKQYFGRFVDRKESLDLADLEIRWRIAQTLFHNEAGRTGSVDRATYDRGVALADRILANGFEVGAVAVAGGTPAAGGGVGAAAAPPGSVTITTPAAVGGPTAGAAGGAATTVGASGAAAAVTPTPVLTGTASATASAGGVEIVVGGRYTVRVPPGADPAMVSALLDILDRRR
ncbi:M23 family metallopeptidase [Hansschlegelia zhihuaiae]|nr:M23 family metallopeptidase [Hansschlegelia zhihuaiae]